MTYYLKDWFKSLKKNEAFDLNSNDSLENLWQRLILFFVSITSFLSINCLLLGFLTKYVSTGYKEFGLMFLLTTFVVLTCSLFFYPSYNLINLGYINLRIMRWIYSITSISVFFFLIRNYTQSCSTLILCGTLGIKFFREIPFRFPNTFTYNELLIVSSFVSCGIFTFITNLSKTAEKDEVIIIEIFIFCYWLSLFSLMTLIVLIIKAQIKADKNFLKDNKLAKIRKIFHLLILIVFLLGFLYDRSLLLLCSFGMLILLLILETVRYFKIEPIGTLVQEFLEIFLDEKDTNSSLILSHIYLLVGLSFPFWLSDAKKFNIAELSGFITVGIGDSFAAIIGSKFGKHKLPGSNKSVEGTAAMVLSQLIFYLILFKIGLVDLTNNWNMCFVALNLVLSGYIESFTIDNDNLILPVVIYPFLNLIK